MVKPDAEVTLENGSSPSFFVEVHDPAGNVTCGAAKMNVFCKFAGGGGLPNYSCDCSASGSATLTGPPLIVKKMAGELQLTARIEIVGMKTVKPVERVVWLKPSGRVSQLQLFCSLNGKETEIKSGQALEMEAGSVLENISELKLLSDFNSLNPEFFPWFPRDCSSQ
ncbi:structural maintenance of chromosomes flexible hinge domain-containing protein 1-like [Aplysia californica]|uniref:Structural maintenance of chromosomes flexible hinge domain-containing protein 1-like n=1 Tax=Aplysia californica TaxID=6500 RepID=A0ABM1A873_APLCA|nr:structural maintenance of chromosomes flexible hinge domain-containing protein 1-like [Aplysia californica]